MQCGGWWVDYMVDCEHRRGMLNPDLGERPGLLSEKATLDLRQDDRREKLRKFQISSLERLQSERKEQITPEKLLGTLCHIEVWKQYQGSWAYPERNGGLLKDFCQEKEVWPGLLFRKSTLAIVWRKIRLALVKLEVVRSIRELSYLFVLTINIFRS